MKKEIKGFVSSTKRADGFYFFSSIHEEAGDLPATLIIHEPEQIVQVRESQLVEAWTTYIEPITLSTDIKGFAEALGFKVELGK